MIASTPQSISQVSSRLLTPTRLIGITSDLVQMVETLESRLTAFAANQGVVVLRASLAVIFLWFGALKFVPGLSPAEALAGRTIEALTLGLIHPNLSLPGLACFECALGGLLLLGIGKRWTTLALLGHLMGTLTPLILFPGEAFHGFGAPTLVGQYILKNLVLIAAALVLTGHPHRAASTLQNPGAEAAA